MNISARFRPYRLPAWAAFLVVCSALPLRAAEPADPLVVSVSGGSVRGKALPEGLGAVYKGLPFAAPPIGPLRWREPMPVLPWEGIRDASISGPPAEQAGFGWNNQAAAASSEDCLYLDVWTPQPAPAHAPVMVWIHGGGNVAGAGGFDPLYDGRPLISHGVVLVVIEYRLGVFGYFSHPALTAESPHHASGNYGILDQVAALQWVHDNIAGFGGDPANVTIFGQSAGATDVVALMATPLSSGLFAHAISESGMLIPGMTQAQAEGDRAGAVLALKAVPPGPHELESLRTLPAAEVLKLGGSQRVFTTDGWVFPVSPVDAWRSHREHAVPFLIGANAVEFPVSALAANAAKLVSATMGDLGPRAMSLYGLNAATPAAPDPLYGDGPDQLGSDLFRCVSIVYGEWHTEAGQPCWQYEFDRAIPPHPHVAHSGDLPYVFGHLSSTGSLPGAYQDADRRLSATIEAYWTNFAKSGNPNGHGLPAWSPYGFSARRYLDFTVAGEAVGAENERAPFRELFRAMMDRSDPTAGN